MLSTNEKVMLWAKDKGILNFPPQGQATKVVEEVGELTDAVMRFLDNDEQVRAELEDAVGDSQVTLIILSGMIGVDYDEALSETKLNMDEYIMALSSPNDKEVDRQLVYRRLVPSLLVNLGVLMTAINKSWEDEKHKAYVQILSDLRAVAFVTDVDFDKALDKAYNVIADRKGKLSADGSFVKEEDLRNL